MWRNKNILNHQILCAYYFIEKQNRNVCVCVRSGSPEGRGNPMWKCRVGWSFRLGVQNTDFDLTYCKVSRTKRHYTIKNLLGSLPDKWSKRCNVRFKVVSFRSQIKFRSCTDWSPFSGLIQNFRRAPQPSTWESLWGWILARVVYVRVAHYCPF